MITRRSGLAILLLVAVLVPLARAETAREILDRRKALEAGPRQWKDRAYTMTIRISGRGSDRVRELEVYEQHEGEVRKTVIFFRAPADVKGTAFLSIAKGSGPADQWLYLPELQRVRQVTSRTRNESFVGTDLTYGDLDLVQEIVNWTENDTAATLRSDETLDGTATSVIEFVPKREDVAYKKIVVWIGKDDLVARQIELSVDGDQPKKRVRQSDVRTVGAIPVPYTTDVETLGAGTHTRIELKDVKYDQGLEADLFTQRALERGER